MRSSGGGHGPQGDVPEHINLDDLETVGEREVEMDYPAERETEQVARLCPYCERPFQGKNGVMIHLGQTAGRKNHPDDAAERHSEDDFPRVEVDEQGNITSVIDDVGDAGDVDRGKGAVPVQRVYTLLADLIADGDTQTAHRVRRYLIGGDTEDRSWRPEETEPPDEALYGALLSHYYADDPDSSVTAAVEPAGIMIACRDEFALLTADEATDLSAALEQETGESQGRGEMADLITFLRTGVSMIEERTDRNFHEEFADYRTWRDEVERD